MIRVAIETNASHVDSIVDLVLASEGGQVGDEEQVVEELERGRLLVTLEDGVDDGLGRAFRVDGARIELVVLEQGDGLLGDLGGEDVVDGDAFLLDDGTADPLERVVMVVLVLVVRLLVLDDELGLGRVGLALPALKHGDGDCDCQVEGVARRRPQWQQRFGTWKAKK